MADQNKKQFRNLCQHKTMFEKCLEEAQSNDVSDTTEIYELIEDTCEHALNYLDVSFKKIEDTCGMESLQMLQNRYVEKKPRDEIAKKNSITVRYLTKKITACIKAIS